MSKTESFEQRINELEKITKILEDGDTPLEEAIENFEKGIKIAAECNKILGEAEMRITKILETADGKAEVPFDNE